MANSYKYYAVAKGRKVGIYTSYYGGAEPQIKGVTGAAFKGFNDIDKAGDFLIANGIEQSQVEILKNNIDGGVPKLLSRKCFNANDVEDFDAAYGNIVSSEEFRRLQDKTQVFPLAKDDYVRTRLTHSIEVSIIAKELMATIFQKYDDGKYGFSEQKNVKDFSKIVDENIYDLDEVIQNPEYRNSAEIIVSCASLLHDLGNPPFGHFGEATIRYWFNDANLQLLENIAKDITGKAPSLTDDQREGLRHFEGNAQALRILSKNYYKKEKAESNPLQVSFAIISAMVKYPTLASGINKKGEVSRHKMGVNDAEKEAFEKMSQAVWGNDKLTIGSINRNPFAYIVEAADDIGYLVSDIQDAVRTKTLSITLLKNKLEKYGKLGKEIIDSLEEGNMEKWGLLTRKALIESFVNAFIKKENYEKLRMGELEKSLFEATELKELEEKTKELLREHVYEHELLVKPEIAAVTMINSLMDKFVTVAAKFAFLYDKNPQSRKNDYKGLETDSSRRAVDRKIDAYEKLTDPEKKIYELIPTNFINDFKDWYDWYRVVNNNKKPESSEVLYHGILIATDYISSMTDNHAKDVYHIINPNY